MDEPGNIILSEKDKSQKAMYYMIPLIWTSRLKKSTETESSIVAA